MIPGDQGVWGTSANQETGRVGLGAVVGNLRRSAASAAGLHCRNSFSRVKCDSRTLLGRDVEQCAH